MKRSALFTMLLVLLASGAAQAQVSVRSARLDLPASTPVTPGSAHTLVMQVSSLVGLNTLQQFKLAIGFDPAQLTVTDVRTGSSLAAWPGADILVEQETGLVRVTGLTGAPLALVPGSFLEVDVLLDTELFDGERPRLRVSGAQTAEPILFVSDVQNPGAPIKVAAPDAVLVVNGGITCVAGDALNDGTTDSGDAVAVLRIVTGLIPEPDAQLRCGADANEDGVVNAGDATIILRRAVGLDDELPARVVRDPGVRLVQDGDGFRLILTDAFAVHAVQLDLRGQGDIRRVSAETDLLAAQHSSGSDLRWAAASATTLADGGGEFVITIEADGPVQVQELELFDVAGARLLRAEALVPEKDPSRAGLRLQNSPNPFNPVTTFWMDLPVAGRVSLDLFDLRGRHLAQLMQEQRPAGRSAWRFAAGPMDLPSGVYFARLTTASGSTVQRVTLLK